MKSVNQLGKIPAGRTIVADDLLEFHAARIILLIHLCGVGNNIEGLTKLAKLDFFVRYPAFFDEAVSREKIEVKSATRTVESSMVRHHYGPWDKRYYRIISYLEGCGLIDVTKEVNTFNFKLTDAGKVLAKRLASEEDFIQVSEQMRQVKKAFGKRAGSSLKNLIYEVFDREVGQKRLGEVIK